MSYHQHTNDAKKLEILKYLVDGKNIALVTDAGTPGISDPGNELIDFLLTYEPDIKVIPIPGPSAITAALSVSGFRTDKFLFLGFWPKKKVSKLIQLIKLVSKGPSVSHSTLRDESSGSDSKSSGRMSTFVFYESPHRIIKTLEIIQKEFGDETNVFVGRELTKLHETLYRGNVNEIVKRLGEGVLKGEIVAIIDININSSDNKL